MTLPNNLKDLQKLCEERSLKFKGKTKSQLKDLLSIEVVTVEEHEEVVSEDLAKLNVKALKEKCEELGLPKNGTKPELIRRLETKNPEGVKVVKWKKRGRKAPSRPSETVDDESDDDIESDDDSAYGLMKKFELRELCVKRNLPGSGTVKDLKKRLEENDTLKEKINNERRCPEIKCESCEENPIRLYEVPTAKWSCMECDQFICDLCKSAHEKIKITRTHRILPYGTLLEFNIERNATINEHNPAIKATVIELDTHFLDITLSDVEVEEEEPSCKRKREDEAEDDENESFELVYETPMAKIGYKNNKRMHLEVVSNTFVPETPEVTREVTPEITPPPVWYTPVPQRRRNIFETVSPIQETPVHSSIATFVQESPPNLNVSKDMFADSMHELSTCVPETPIPATPQVVRTQKTVQIVEIVPETPSPPTPPPMPSHRASHYVETDPITPARVIYQRWSNWAHTRLAHLPDPEPEQHEATVIVPCPVDIQIQTDDFEEVVTAAVTEIEPEEAVIEAPKNKTVTAKAVKEKKTKISI